MGAIRFKKPIFPVSKLLRSYLTKTNREIDASIEYRDLLHYNSSFALFDSHGADTLWETLVYSETDRDYIYQALRKVYALLKVAGDLSVIEHLYIDRVDYCLYANTHPIRVRVVNKLNDLFDYFYIKQADASRIYGMELEHLLSPNKINYLVSGDIFIEEHIQGIPGDTFIEQYLAEHSDFNPIRIAKEFVKFNERCLVQLLGDMRGDNFVVEVIPDFDELHFRIRAIDFDQEAYEGSSRIYLPQYFKENNPIINLGFRSMSPVVEFQYQKEERMRLRSRVKSSQVQLDALLQAMAADTLSTPDRILQLKNELSELYQDEIFLKATTMGEVVSNSIQMLDKYPVRKRVTIKPFVA